jgi:hypothetical protein
MILIGPDGRSSACDGAAPNIDAQNRRAAVQQILLGALGIIGFLPHFFRVRSERPFSSLEIGQNESARLIYGLQNCQGAALLSVTISCERN